MLAGLLSHIGLKRRRDGRAAARDYQGARGTRFAIFPGSGPVKKHPEFVMAAELVETGRLWARVNAAIAPEWAEEVGGHLLKRTYSEPHWEKKRGAVMALEKVTLYGVPIVAERPVNYGRIDPEVARDLFIRHALVRASGGPTTRFFADNQALLEEVEELETGLAGAASSSTRRRSSTSTTRGCGQVVSTAHFDSWWKREQRTRPTC